MSIENARRASDTTRTIADTELSELIGLASSEITTKPVSLAYRGSHGCACGCLGTYSDTDRVITGARNDILKMVADTSRKAMIRGRIVTVREIMVCPDMFVSVEYQPKNYQGAVRVVTLYTDGRTA